jgi:hypothetical protein
VYSVGNLIGLKKLYIPVGDVSSLLLWQSGITDLKEKNIIRTGRLLVLELISAWIPFTFAHLEFCEGWITFND